MPKATPKSRNTWSCCGSTRDNTPVLIATKDVETLEGRGVTLMGDDPQQYVTAPKYEDKLYPSLRRIH